VIPLSNTRRAVTPNSGDRIDDLKKAVADFERSESWSALRPAVGPLLGQYSFGLGVVYGIGENVVTSVVELLQLVKTFLLADLYDRVNQPPLSAAFNPIALVQRLFAEASMRTWRGELEEAHREREALIEELRYAMTHVGEVVGNIRDAYLVRWNRFERLSRDRTLTGQFQAGRIFGEVLIEVVSMIGGGTAAVRAASKVPRLARLARLKIPPRSTAHAGRAATAGEAPVTPSQLRPTSPPAEPPAPRRDTFVLDKEGVPIGARKGIAKPGLPPQPLSKEGWPDLPAAHARNFTSAEPVTLKPGTKLYRIIDDPERAAGAYWSESLPASRAQWRADYAVKTDWNTNGRYIEYIVPDGPGLNVWRGPAAAQDLIGSGFHLPGGGTQVWLRPQGMNLGTPRPTGW
jgi:hypothetical protein